jgi:hypothetical protein
VESEKLLNIVDTEEKLEKIVRNLETLSFRVDHLETLSSRIDNLENLISRNNNKNGELQVVSAKQPGYVGNRQEHLSVCPSDEKHFFF